MSLTIKLVLGFVFALALQIAQIVASAHFTGLAQEAATVVANGLEASLSVQASLEALQQIHTRSDQDRQNPDKADGKVHRVYLDEVTQKVEVLDRTMADADPPTLGRIHAHLVEIESQIVAVERAQARHANEEVTDGLAFLDDAAREVEQDLRHFQVLVREAAQQGAEREREVHDLPVRAGLTIAILGVVVLAVFVTWFSRQLVLPIEKAWSELERRVADRTRELASTVEALEQEIVRRQSVQSQKDELNRQLVETSRRAGMAEIANGVLHNVGNVLNNVNVSTDLLVRQMQDSRISGVEKVAELLQSHSADLADFLTRSPQGSKLPGYLTQLAAHLRSEQAAMLEETSTLSKRIEHMKDIVGRQQSYARCGGVTTKTNLGQMVQEVVALFDETLRAHDIALTCDVDATEPIVIDRSRVLQILMNLVSNAKHAVLASESRKGTIVIAARVVHGMATIDVTDSGCGIAPENLAKIFALGFTTKRNGHGFGLHHSANAATEMGGRLTVESPGPGRGATFRLELPTDVPVEVQA